MNNKGFQAMTLQRRLNNAEQLKNLADEYFVRMMLPDSERKAEPYVAEERMFLQDLISSIANISELNFVVIGSGTMWYVELAYDVARSYVAIEPLANIFFQKQVSFLLSKHDKIKILGKQFGEFDKKDIPRGNSIFVFHFNILSYIPDPVAKINQYLKSGDILYISSWNNTQRALAVRREYFGYLNLYTNSSSAKVDPEDPRGICNLDFFPFDKLRHYKEHKRIKNDVTDILIIYC